MRQIIIKLLTGAALGVLYSCLFICKDFPNITKVFLIASLTWIALFTLANGLGCKRKDD